MYATAILRDQCVTESVKACTTSLRGDDPHDQYAHTGLVSQARISHEGESCTGPEVTGGVCVRFVVTHNHGKSITLVFR
jgi:hypothetical protein